ncbi:hypothetical protein BDV98DRAFT_574760, partial [Pterulicium gracile]
MHSAPHVPPTHGPRPSPSASTAFHPTPLTHKPSGKYSTNPEWARLPFPYTPQPKRFYRRLPHLLLNHPRPHTGTILLRVSMQPLHVPHPLIRPVPCPRVLAQRRHSKLRILCEFGLQHVYDAGMGSNSTSAEG